MSVMMVIMMVATQQTLGKCLNDDIRDNTRSGVCRDGWVQVQQ